MLISWNWLKDYVPLNASPQEVVERLMMAGLNHESTTPIGDDFAIDLEITSNRADCLGHIGIAREAAVLYQLPLKVSPAQPRVTGSSTGQLTSVVIECPSLCRRYTARVMQGVKIRSSPDWLVRRLATIGIAAVNNIVDCTNYVMMECGQPLHAFDFVKLRGRKIIVREPRKGEQIQAIDHRVYDLSPGMCVIADENSAVAIGGVMGGAESEVSGSTTHVLIEAADFAPLSIRSTARKLNLHSPSSYRFERGVDPLGLDWASRRCCELIQETAGGELADGVVDVGGATTPRPPIVFRLSQLKRILGIEIPAGVVHQILTSLGLQSADGSRIDNQAQTSISVTPPSWRGDLTREIDLVEEVARIHGYDKIPEDVAVPMVPSHRRESDRTLQRVREVLTGCGFDEAITTSVVSAELSSAVSPWTTEEPLRCGTPLLKGADLLRRSLLPSLLEARRINESLANPLSELFETARIYLPRVGQLPHEQWTLGIVSNRGFEALKGVVEVILDSLRIREPVQVEGTSVDAFERRRSCELKLGQQRLGFLGEVAANAAKHFGIRDAVASCELDLDLLARLAQHSAKFIPQSAFPSISRDLNLIVDEPTRWADLAQAIRHSAGPFLEELEYQETYRDTAKDGAGKKRILFTISLRSTERTLTNEEADRTRDDVVRACQTGFGARLLG